jgi:histidine triad (HIT) family protein
VSINSFKHMQDCIFCKITSKQIPTNMVSENDEFMVIHDKFPKAPVHMLIIPKKHLGSVSEVGDNEEALLGRAILLARKIAGEQKLTDYKLLFNNGKYSEIPHLHLHLVSGPDLTFVV